MTVCRHIWSVLLLPFNATVTLPALLLWLTRWEIGFGGGPIAAATGIIVGVSSIVIGLTLMVTTIRAFARIGRGTLAPWDPTVHLVIQGPYRYVRNPMISGVGFMILGDGLATGSLSLLGWFAIFMLVNIVYMPLFEEPGLVARFGDSYREYAKHVPRWIPRRTPWSAPAANRDAMEPAAPVWSSRIRDHRGRRVVFLAHCLLNENTRYLGGARRAGAVAEIINPLLEQGVGIVQLPCPEEQAWGGVLKPRLLLFYGSEGKLRYRFRSVLLPLVLWYTRRVYRKLARQTADQIQDYQSSGATVIGVIGIDASPSCVASSPASTCKEAYTGWLAWTRIRRRRKTRTSSCVRRPYRGRDSISSFLPSSSRNAACVFH